MNLDFTAEISALLLLDGSLHLVMAVVSHVSCIIPFPANELHWGIIPFIERTCNAQKLDLKFKQAIRIPKKKLFANSVVTNGFQDLRVLVEDMFYASIKEAFLARWCNLARSCRYSALELLLKDHFPEFVFLVLLIGVIVEQRISLDDIGHQPLDLREELANQFQSIQAGVVERNSSGSILNEKRNVEDQSFGVRFHVVLSAQTLIQPKLGGEFPEMPSNTEILLLISSCITAFEGLCQAREILSTATLFPGRSQGLPHVHHEFDVGVNVIFFAVNKNRGRANPLARNESLSRIKVEDIQILAKEEIKDEHFVVGERSTYFGRGPRRLPKKLIPFTIVLANGCCSLEQLRHGGRYTQLLVDTLLCLLQVVL